MIINNGTVKKYLNIAGEKMHAPEQKIALVGTALLIQPIIDMSNKNIDKETRKTATARDIAKIIAGAITGISIRYLGIEVAKRLTRYKPILGSTPKHMTGVQKDCGILIPKNLIGKNAFKEISIEDFDNKLLKYIKAMGTGLATLIMLYTNFSFDAKKTTEYTPKVYKFLFNEEFDKEKRVKKEQKKAENTKSSTKSNISNTAKTESEVK